MFVNNYNNKLYLQLQPPPGWSFTPTEISISVDGVTDFCSKGTDINFIFNGFGIAGKVIKCTHMFNSLYPVLNSRLKVWEQVKAVLKE